MLPGKGSRNPEGLRVTLLEHPDSLAQPGLGRAEPGRQGWETLAFPDFWREARNLKFMVSVTPRQALANLGHSGDSISVC